MYKMISLAHSIAHAKVQGNPYKVTYAVTYQCNARCRICGIWKKYLTAPEKLKEELTMSEIDSIFADFDLSWVSLTGGEPFLRDLFSIASTIQKHNPHLQLLTIPTNGSLPDVTFKTVERIVEETRIPNLFVSISLDGDENLHNHLKGVEGLWKKARKTYQLLNSVESDRFEVFLEFTVSKYNAGHLQPALDSFGVTDYSQVILTAAHSSHFYGFDLTDLHRASSAAQVKEFLSLCNYPTLEKIIPHVYTKLLEKYLMKTPISLPCVSGRSSFFLDPYGVLYPCISMDAPFGSLRESRLHQLLKEEKAHSIIQQIKKGKCPGCWTPCEAYQTILENLPKAVGTALFR